MISGNTLVAGQWYEITGVHPTLYDDGTTSGTTIYLMAISTNKLATSGIGTFYNPKYNQAVSGFGIWDDKMYGTFSSIVGNFDYIGKETVTADNGATGLVLADGMIRWVSGDWSGATSITGGTSGATANVSGFTSPTYSVGAKVFWGGYAWSNVNGNVGSATNVLTLNAEWTKIAYNTTDYNIAYDEIEYDYANNMIIMRYDVVNNIKVIFSALAGVYFSGTLGIPYNGIAVQQWGNGFNGTVGGHSKIVTNGYDESVNFRGASQLNMTFEILGRNYNIEFGKDSKQENITFKNSSTNNNISLGAGAMQTSIGLGVASTNSNISLGAGAMQTSIGLGVASTNSNISLGAGAMQTIEAKGDNMIDNIIIGASGGFMGVLELKANVENVVITENKGTRAVTFKRGTYDFNNQTLVGSILYATFDVRGESVIIPSLAGATHIFNDNLIKEVYMRPDNSLKIKFMNDTDTLQVENIDA